MEGLRGNFTILNSMKSGRLYRLLFLFYTTGCLTQVFGLDPVFGDAVAARIGTRLKNNHTRVHVADPDNHLLFQFLTANLIGQILVAAAVQIRNTILYQEEHFRTIESFHCLVKSDV